MTLAELIAECARLADDKAEPPLWLKAEWTKYLNEALREACLRARLVVDDEGAASEIDIEPGVKRYRLHPAVIDVMSAETSSGPVVGWTVDETHLVLDRAPSESATLQLAVVRFPLKELTQDGDEPEIRPHHHRALTDWALRCAYLKQDTETLDPPRAARHEAAFEAYFGVRPTASVARKQRRKTPRVVRSIQF